MRVTCGGDRGQHAGTVLRELMYKQRGDRVREHGGQVRWRQWRECAGSVLRGRGWLAQALGSVQRCMMVRHHVVRVQKMVFRHGGEKTVQAQW